MLLSIISNWWWGRDPDIVDDVSGLSRRDIHAVTKTWRSIYKDAGNNGLLIFIRLFQKNPETKTFFRTIKDMNEQEIMNNVQFKAHAINLMSAIDIAVNNLQEPGVVVASMNKLGNSHLTRHIRKEHFEDFYTVFMDVLSKELFLKESELKSWVLFMDFILKHIFEKLNAN